ncbi:MAG: family 78 glycoside hydrolase catalytic domain [Bacteroidota bacterium]|nr:family 78 glycoside hydrolase catalytic domain [Bacteroidota bacterium]
MKKTILAIVLPLLLLTVKAQVQISSLTTEHLINPIGLDESQPKFGWILTSKQRNVMQTAYEIQVSENANVAGKLIWQTGKVSSDASINIPFGGEKLQSGKRYFWRVRAWDNKGNCTGWSNVNFWQMALLNTADWKAKWIEADIKEVKRLCPQFRKSFSAAKTIQSATAYITAHGMYEANINGRKVGDAFLTPGFTSYNKRLQYQTYDVTSMLQKGENVIAVNVGNGWYRGYLGWVTQVNTWGDKLGLLLQLDISYADGTKETVMTDGSWKSATGSIVTAEIYHGETIDANKETTGWKLPNYDDSKWAGVKVADYKLNNLIATYNEPVRKHEVFKATKVITTPKGEKVLDFGQNMVGFESIKIKGQKGDTIRIYHAEVLDKAGNFYTENLRTATAISTYVLSGNGEEIFEPHFTFYGFRYIKIVGVRGEINPENFPAVALYSDMPKTGSFTTSNSLINQLQSNITWGQKGNFLDIPTDCPQRDERLGWTGDAQVFVRTAAYNGGVYNFFNKWMKDLAADQWEDGRVPWVIPNIFTTSKKESGSTGWSDASTIIPWNIYMAYGDKRILENQYPSMKKWVDYMKNKSVNSLWNTEKFHFGDWLFFRPSDDKDGIAAITDKNMIAQCFFAHSTQMLINAAQVLGKTDDMKLYSDLLSKVKKAYMDEYMTANGGLVSSTQTAYVLALHFDMLPENLRQQAADRLVKNIAKYNNHITTGFIGTPYICHVLSRFGYEDVAYKLLLQKTYPSWLYPVTVGATTIWERWDAQKPDGSFQTSEMNSFNHYAYGAIGDWMYREAAGLREEAAGYKEIIVQPHPGGDFTYMNADLKTSYGNAASHWKIEGNQLIMEVEIPVNTTATIFIPAKSVAEISESGKPLSASKDVTVSVTEGEYVVAKTGSGKYIFVANR